MIYFIIIFYSILVLLPFIFISFDILKWYDKFDKISDRSFNGDEYILKDDLK